MRVGICTIIAVDDMQVVTYVCATYELALAQAHENLKGVGGRIEQHPERKTANGLRETVFKIVTHEELIKVEEVNVGTRVLPVPAGRRARIVSTPWPV